MLKHQSILSTKKLNQVQLELVLNSGVSITHFDILTITKNDVSIPSKAVNLIITSSNALHVLNQLNSNKVRVFVVGDKTSETLINHEFNVAHTALNSSKLAAYIIKHHKNEHFHYLCGSHRRDELPDALLEAQIGLSELKVYDSQPIMKSYGRIFDAVLFYSPLGVHAFAKANPEKLKLAICIGETTASVAKSYTNDVRIASKTTAENTIVTAIKALQND